MTWKFWTWAWRRPPVPHIELVRGDITKQRVDAIVNAAKPSLMGGGGVDGAIHKAGGPSIVRQCRELRATAYPNGLPTGEAVHTEAGWLPASYVIHTVGPIYDPRTNQTALLRSCYLASLEVADNLGLRSVAFPLISAGAYGWPLESAVAEAITAIKESRTKVEEVRLVLFDERAHRIADRILHWRGSI